MQKLIRILAGSFLLLVFIASIGFAFVNTTPVGLSIGIREFAPRPMAVWIIAAFALGGLMGVIFGSGITTFLKDKLEIRNLRKQLKAREAEIQNLRTVTLKDLK